jgi:hypothetical protein
MKSRKIFWQIIAAIFLILLFLLGIDLLIGLYGLAVPAFERLTKPHPGDALMGVAIIGFIFMGIGFFGGAISFLLACYIRGLLPTWLRYFLPLPYAVFLVGGFFFYVGSMIKSFFH